MSIEQIKKRLDRIRPMSSVTIRMPKAVIEDLKRIAPVLGFSDYQPLIRAYVGQGLRKDLDHLENDAVTALLSGLKKRGVNESVLQEALAEVVNRETVRDHLDD